jgi:hypothetical protein
MSDDFWKRHLEETERFARLADPLREFKALQSPILRVQEQLAALCRDPLEDIQAQMKALIHPLEQLPEWVKDNYGQDAIAKQVKAITEPFHRVAEQLRAVSGQDAIAEQIKTLLEPFNGAQAWIKAFRSEEEERLRQWSTMFDDFARQLRDLPDEVRGQLTVLMDQGWCLDPEMPHTWGRDLVEAFQEGENDEAQEWLIDYFKGRVDEIEQTLVERHPKRSAIIADAFQAHRERRYHLSIPVLLAQADGVIHDRHQRQLFSKKRTANLMQVLSGLPEDDMRAIFIAAFYVDIPLTRNTQLLPDGFDGLNRHADMHGTDPKYGTEINSLRAVSILNLASHMVTEEVDVPGGASRISAACSTTCSGQEDPTIAEARGSRHV